MLSCAMNIIRQRSYRSLLLIAVVAISFSSLQSVAAASTKRSDQELPPTCPSPIYCYGELLHTVQMAAIYKDSKTFVDKKLLFPPDEVLKKFESLKKNFTGDIPKEDLEKFVNENFKDGNELEIWEPKDWIEKPWFVSKLADPKIADWAIGLNLVWKNLSRKVTQDVADHPDQYSIIYTPNGFVIPGGRFKELYYWDTYWIIKGLLLSEMHETARGVIMNLAWLVKKLGHVPNGSRHYYHERSQPPMLASMAEAYLDRVVDGNFLIEIFDVIDKEMDWWIQNRMVDVPYEGKKYKLFRYYAPSKGPRPESYKEDYLTASKLPTEEDKTNKYISLKSAAESGWDFSSRWFIKDGTNQGDLSSIDTANIIPVDLNAIIYKSFKLMMDWSIKLRARSAYYKYDKLSRELLKAINNVLYCEKDGIWYDYDLKNQKVREYFYLSNVVPLWANSHDLEQYDVAKSVIAYIERNNITKFIGGSPTSLYTTGEQWDYPNAWPPLQSFLIQGLDSTRTKAGRTVAAELAKIWLCTNYIGYADFKDMFEKYNVERVGLTGSGGEYDAQTGFGWTNGIAFEFLDRWPKFSVEDCAKSP